MCSLSLLEHCQKCGSKCCIPGKTIGAPIVSKEERGLTVEILGASEDHFQRVELKNGAYYYVPVRQENGRCIFLSADNLCKVQAAKFPDCIAYPIKAVRRDGQIIYLIDIHCPAAPYLTPEFITAAKEVALESLESWDPDVYQHWLDHFIAWIKDAMELEAYLALTFQEKAALPLY